MCTETDTNTINKCHKKIHFNSSLIFYLELNLRPKQNLTVYKKLLATTAEGLQCSPLLPDPGNGHRRHLGCVRAKSLTYTTSKNRLCWVTGRAGVKEAAAAGTLRAFPAPHDKG